MKEEKSLDELKNSNFFTIYFLKRKFQRFVLLSLSSVGFNGSCRMIWWISRIKKEIFNFVGQWGRWNHGRHSNFLKEFLIKASLKGDKTFEKNIIIFWSMLLCKLNCCFTSVLFGHYETLNRRKPSICCTSSKFRCRQSSKSTEFHQVDLTS